MIRSDPIRIVEAVVTGVSFLGAGTIIYHRTDKSLEGLTTAASTPVSAGVGLAIGLAQFLLGTDIALLTLLILRGVTYLEMGI